jgi:nitrite reductase (NADH) large subunit
LCDFVRRYVLCKANGSTEAAVLGGGLLGLEAAKAVRDLERIPCSGICSRLMLRQLDKGQ